MFYRIFPTLSIWHDMDQDRETNIGRRAVMVPTKVGPTDVIRTYVDPLDDVTGSQVEFTSHSGKTYWFRRQKVRNGE